MSIQGQDGFDYEWLTYSRVRVLRELAEYRTEAEGADNIGMTFSGFRSIVEDIKNKSGLHSVRDIGRWWRCEAPRWLAWVAEQGGLSERGYGA
jgi:hypothetical protein